MYMDMDSILFRNTQKQEDSASCRWVSSIDKRTLTREDLALLYGCWADDAAASDFLTPEDGDPLQGHTYVA